LRLAQAFPIRSSSKEPIYPQPVEFPPSSVRGEDDFIAFVTTGACAFR